MPRWPEKELNTQELPLAKDKEVVLPPSGSIADSLDELRTVEVHAQPLQDDYAAALAFAEEKVTVMIHEDTDPNAENPVQVAVNGTNQFFFRGQPQDVKRKYVEVLARCKRTRISTPEITDGSGARTNVVRQSSSLRYPFSVMYDPNPRGAVWLKNIMTEAA
jgi:hypothetical protein